ncbi:hypothetical protein BH09MYX1_BH09MYX1_37630 [soil metagenome]
MTTMTPLAASTRSASGKGAARRLRTEGKIPAVAYGKGFASTPIAVVPKDVLGILKGEHGQNSVIQMKVEGSKPSDILVMIKDFSYHPVTRSLEHVDFVEVKLDREVEVEVKFVVTGKPVGVTEGGVLRQVYRTLPVRCLPDRIPLKIEADATALALGDHISTQQLGLPEGVTVRLPAEQTLVAVVAPEKEKEEAVADAVPGAAPTAGAAPAAGAAAGAAGAKDAKAAAPAAAAKDSKKK